MKKGLIVYASQNGSTRKVAEKISDGLVKHGCNVDLVDMNQHRQFHPEDYNFLGVGSPTYLFRPSYQVLDMLDTIGTLEGKAVFTFVTYGSEIGDGAHWLRRKLARMKTIDFGHFQCQGKHLFPGYTSRGYLFSPHSPSDKSLIAAESFGQEIALRLASNTFVPASQNDKGTHVVLRFERFVTNRFFIKFLYSYFFSPNTTPCTSCGTCVNECPTRNITFNDKGRPKWGRNCILCCTCEIKCPQNAVSSPISWFIFTPFLAYNILRTRRHKIPFVKV